MHLCRGGNTTLLKPDFQAPKRGTNESSPGSGGGSGSAGGSGAGGGSGGGDDSEGSEQPERNPRRAELLKTLHSWQMPPCGS